MPETVWVSAIAFDTSTDPPTAAPVRTSAPKRGASAAPVRAATGADCLAEVKRRLEAAREAGALDVAPDEQPVEAISITAGEFALLLRLVLPEEYVRPEKPVTEPTGTPPGTAARIDVYRQRVARGERLYHSKDATAHGAHDPGLRIVQRKNGTGVKAVGWEGEGEGDTEAEV